MDATYQFFDLLCILASSDSLASFGFLDEALKSSAHLFDQGQLVDAARPCRLDVLLDGSGDVELHLVARLPCDPVLGRDHLEDTFVAYGLDVALDTAAEVGELFSRWIEHRALRDSGRWKVFNIRGRGSFWLPPPQLSAFDGL